MPCSKEIYELIRQDILNRTDIFAKMYEDRKDWTGAEYTPEYQRYLDAPKTRIIDLNTGKSTLQCDVMKPDIIYDESTRKPDYLGPQDFLDEFKSYHNGKGKPWKRLYKRGPFRVFRLFFFSEFIIQVEERDNQVKSIQYWPPGFRPDGKGGNQFNPVAIPVFETKF